MQRALSPRPEIQSQIQAADAEIELMNRGSRAEQYDEITLSGGEAQELIAIQKSEDARLQGHRPFDRRSSAELIPSHQRQLAEEALLMKVPSVEWPTPLCSSTSGGGGGRTGEVILPALEKRWRSSSRSAGVRGSQAGAAPAE